MVNNLGALILHMWILAFVWLPFALGAAWLDRLMDRRDRREVAQRLETARLRHLSLQTA